MPSKASQPPGSPSLPAADQGQRDVFDNGLLRVEHDNYYVGLGGRSLKLPRKEFLIVSRLARNYDRIVAAEDIWRYAWGDGAPFNSESLHVHMYRLRRRLEAAGIHIDTMVNVGYRLTDTAETRAPAK